MTPKRKKCTCSTLNPLCVLTHTLHCTISNDLMITTVLSPLVTLPYPSFSTQLCLVVFNSLVEMLSQINFKFSSAQTLHWLPLLKVKVKVFYNPPKALPVL